MRNEEVERLSMPSMSFMEASTSGINEQRAALTGFNVSNLCTWNTTLKHDTYVYDS